MYQIISKYYGQPQRAKQTFDAYLVLKKFPLKAEFKKDKKFLTKIEVFEALLLKHQLTIIIFKLLFSKFFNIHY